MLLATRTEQDAVVDQRKGISSSAESPTSTVNLTDLHMSDYYTIAAVLDTTPDDNNDMMTSFSNPNYGLDAINSNSLTSSGCSDGSDLLPDNVINASLRSQSYDTVIDNGYNIQQQQQQQQHFVDNTGQMEGGSTGSCSTDSDEDSCADSVVDTPTVSGRRSPRQRDVITPAALADDDVAKDAMTSSIGPESKENSLVCFRDVYSPDSNDSGILTDDVRGRRTNSRGDGAQQSHVKELQIVTPETVDGTTSGQEEDETTPSATEPPVDVGNIVEAEELPIGWEKHEDECGAYYWHIKSGTIQRERPQFTPADLLAKSARASDVRSSSRQNSSDNDVTTPHSDDPAHLSQPVFCGRSVDDGPQCHRCTQLDGQEEYPIRFAVRSLGWVQMSDDELTPEHSSRAVNRCIVGLSVGKNDINDVVGRWGDGKSLYLELDEENVTLIDPQDLSILNIQPIQSIRVWGVGRNNGRERDFAYVARDCATRKHMCHVFRCDGLARHIANALRDICKKILAERALRGSATGLGSAAADGGGDRSGSDSPADEQGSTAYRSGNARPNNLPNLSRVGGVMQAAEATADGEQLTFESIYKNTSFPTPMEEPKKIVRCHYLGTTQVLRPTGVDVLNNAMDNVYTRALPEKWVYVNVAVAPSTITITEHGKPENVFVECRVRFLSFMGIAMNNVRLCAFIMHCAQDQFVAHVFHCDPSASALCKTIEAACKLRYQKCLDAHSRSALHPSHVKRQTSAGQESKGLRLSIRQGVQNVLGNLTKGCKP